MTLTRFQHLAIALTVPLTLCAQVDPNYPVPETEAPAGVAQALKERASQFFQYHVGPVNRRAIDLVAEDTQDFYYQSGKVQFVGFSLKEVTFTKDFQRAAVRLETTQPWEVQGLSTMATTPVVTTWKLENGKWVWFLDQQGQVRAATPMGASAPPPAADKLLSLTNPDGTLNLPKDFAAPERVAAQAMAILNQGGLDKSSVTFTAGTAAQEQLLFKNGYGGQVTVALRDVPKIPGLTVTLSKSDLQAREDATVRFVYAPEGPAPVEVQGRKYSLRLSLIPFNQEFPITFMLQPAR